MNNRNIKIEGPFHSSPGNKCNSCEKIIEEKEYRRNYNEELYRETGGREGRIYYCVPCGKEIIIAENEEDNKEIKKNLERAKKDAQETIKDCFAILNSLSQRLFQENISGTAEDYKKIKNVQERIKKLGKKTIIDPFTNQECTLIKTDLENLKKNCQDLTNEYISPKEKEEVDNKGKYRIERFCCRSIEIKLDEETNEFYCDYCWETESPNFLKSLKSYHIDKLNEIMSDNGVSAGELNSKNYHSMLTVPDFILTQEGIKDTYQKAEQDLRDYLKEKKGINLDNQKSEIRNQKSEIRNQKSEIRNQKSEIRNQKSEIRNQKSEIRNQKSEIRNQKSEIRNQKSEIRNQKSEIRNQKSEIRNQKSEIRNQKSEIRNQKSERNRIKSAPNFLL